MDLQELAALANKFDQAMVPPELKAKGWVYRDLPGKFTPEYWDLLLSIFGEGNYQIVIMSSGPGWKRGQFFLSPQAFENMKAYSKQQALQTT